MSVTHFLYGNRGFIVQIVQTVIRLLAECLKQYKMQLKRLGILGIIWTEELYFGGQLSGKVVWKRSVLSHVSYRNDGSTEKKWEWGVGSQISGPDEMASSYKGSGMFGNLYWAAVWINIPWIRYKRLPYGGQATGRPPSTTTRMSISWAFSTKPLKSWLSPSRLSTRR